MINHRIFIFRIKLKGRASYWLCLLIWNVKIRLYKPTTARSYFVQISPTNESFLKLKNFYDIIE